MNDTSPDTEQLLSEGYKKKPGSEKLLMALEMFVTARTLVISSLSPHLTNKEIKRELFLRFYGDDFTEKQKKEILLAF